jgi:hypothetical protein
MTDADRKELANKQKPSFFQKVKDFAKPLTKNLEDEEVVVEI